MKQLYRILLLFSWLPFVAGCWDRIEINDLAIVVGAGVDKKGDEVEVTAQIIVPKVLSAEGGGAGDETMVRTGRGATITDAVADAQTKFSRRIFWGHTKVIVFGEELAREGISEYADFFARHPKARLRSHMYVSKASTAKEVLMLHPALERSSSEVMREMSRSPFQMDVTLKDLLEMLESEAHAAVIPAVSILPVEQGQDPLQTAAYISHTAILGGDQMIGMVDEQMTKGLLWFTNQIDGATVTIKVAENEFISTNILRAEMELVPEIEGEKWKMTVKGRLVDEIIMNRSSWDVMNPVDIRKIEQRMEEEAEKQMEAVLKLLQKNYKVDALGFADAFERKYPQQWNQVEGNWVDIFSTVEVHYDLKGKVKRPGMSTNSQGM
ncbi:hypothetical protein BEP19_11430 [Ammoniphilus oxalaticus]|uniref:Uncharacterized protein n=1 Tax=Ammoniphilus oxalaticus TaxID=66863 RepID=A0A419SGD7_9BACL|nr:Ger(x)C family spore germination protein [Ammoniphilus oxalaticus]RKD22846.1 hypothetical protein BEP19_11430 [Ammoniphilus oxalaticus]